MEQIGKLLPKQKPAVKSKRTERGDLLDEILGHLNPARVRDGYRKMTHGNLAYQITKVPTKDLYALLSKCDDAERRRPGSWGAVFWNEIRPKKSQL